MRPPVEQRQYLAGLIMSIEIDMTALTTSYAAAGISSNSGSGLYIAQAKVGTAADDNLVSIQLNKPLGLKPQIWIQEHTLDLAVRREAQPGLQVMQFRCVKASDLSSHITDGAFSVLVFGTEQIREGAY